MLRRDASALLVKSLRGDGGPLCGLYGRTRTVMHVGQRRGIPDMNDLLYVLLTAVFFAGMIAYARACHALGRDTLTDREEL